MPATQTQLRRGTAAQCDAMTPAAGEFIIDTTNARGRVGDGSRAGAWPVPHFSDIQKRAFDYATVSGTANAITLTYTVQPIAWASPLGGLFIPTSSNSGSTTIAITGLSGTKTCKKLKNGALADLESGDIISGVPVEWTYDGTYAIIKNVVSSSNSGIELLAVVTGGGSSYDFTTAISGTYYNYVFVLEKVAGASWGSGNKNLWIRVRRSGQGSYDSGASEYTWAMQSTAATGASSAATTTSGSTGATQIKIGEESDLGNDGVSGVVEACGLGQSGRCNFRGMLQSTEKVINSGGSRLSTTALDGVRFMFDAGNISSGTIYMYGRKRSL